MKKNNKTMEYCSGENCPKKQTCIHYAVSIFPGSITAVADMWLRVENEKDGSCKNYKEIQA